MKFLKGKYYIGTTYFNLTGATGKENLSMGEGAEDVPTSEDYDICIQTYQEFDKDILGNYINSNFNYNYNLSTEATRYYEGGKCSNLSEFSYTINNEYFHERPIKELIASLFFGEDENTFSVFLDGSIDSEVSWMIEKHQKRSLIKRRMIRSFGPRQ